MKGRLGVGVGVPNAVIVNALRFRTRTREIQGPQIVQGGSPDVNRCAVRVAVAPRPISNVKPGQAQLLLGWATT